MLNRREFFAAAAVPAIAAAQPGTELPKVDYHVHLDRLVTLEKALELSKERGVRFGIVEHAARPDFAVRYTGMLTSDADLKQFIAKLDGKPVYKGIQAEGIDWMKAFSKEAIAQLDYVLTDALTLPEKDGRLVRLWTREAANIPDKQEFMDRYVDFHVRIMERQPIDIIANPTFLPSQLQAEYDALWTPARMSRIVNAAVAYGVAIEINSAYQLPRMPFLKLAKKAGAKFSFGSNIHGLGVGNIDYGLQAAAELGLTRRDLFTPAPAGKKPVQRRKLA